MSGEALKIISDAMQAIGLEYSFMGYTADAVEALPSTYFMGEYQELEAGDESGEEDNIFILTGFSRENWNRLEQAKDKIKNYFSARNGRTERTGAGAVVAVFYENGFMVPVEDEELKKIQINLKVKEWRVEA